ncbi:MAG: DUF5412 domain-containing protein [Faecalibacterium sp.]|nr:DUF5412 domain-containing protein [Ruminococcus sp.]MCM1392842.1 DUF5412 domain-containing protein [Ruminococcus sp.]MCM1486328.1 DUF5412 domain-containing protein [Faecalibacterium sp.]
MLKRAIKASVIVIVILIAALSGLYYHFFVSMASLPDGELIGEYTYTETDNKINVYLCNGGATTDYAIKADFVDKNNKIKTIYWAYHERNAEVQWIDNETVSINGKIMNVYHDVYDWRRN